MDQALKIEREDSEHGGRYLARLAPGSEAELTYRKTGEHVLSVDHTYTPPAFRGRDVALSLVKRLIADARASGTRIVPICPYVAVQFRRHPEWSDVLAA
jgi:predicted GNAT family acetyltransferase